MRSGVIAIIVGIMLLSSVGAFAQGDWNAVATMRPYPSPYVSDWEDNPNFGNLTITNNTGAAQDAKIYLSLRRNDSQIIGEANSQSILIPPSPPSTILDNTGMVDYETFDYDKSIEDESRRTGRLPEGEYEACIRIDDLDGNILVNHVCAYFTIVYPDPPALIYPFDNENSIWK